ncbi:hypothetical protein ABIA39_000278 [Nocardia sp. GAS34]|uniref:cutinase family protein n=1 Tax=unclassified Nocardia TaxID=2637762 RepID=UPI003D2001A5
MTTTPHASTPRRARPHRYRRGVSGAAVCATAALAAGLCAVPAPALAAPVSGCAATTAVLVSGTGETRPDADPASPSGMLGPLAHALTARYGTDLATRTVAYPASITPTYAASETAGGQALSSTLSSLCPSTRIVVVGYSQGAQVAGDIATLIGHGQGPVPASRVLAVGLVADPHRAASTPTLGTPAAGEGIEGPRIQDFGALADRVRSVCAAGDLYCSVSPQTDPVLTNLGHAITSTPTTTPATQASTGSGSDSVLSQLSGTGGVLDGVNVSSVIGQVLSVLAGMSSLAANLPAIGADLAALPPRLLAGDVNGTHQLAGDLNNQFAPLVTMASQLDLHLIARILTIIAPADTSGLTAAAAQIVQILAGVDVPRLASDLGTAQETAWTALSKLTAGDLVGAATVLTGLLPVAADLAAVAANALTGTAAAPLTALTTASTNSTGAGTGLAQLAKQGSDAASFFASGVHQSGYTSGMNDLTTWLTSRIPASH